MDMIPRKACGRSNTDKAGNGCAPPVLASKGKPSSWEQKKMEVIV